MAAYAANRAEYVRWFLLSVLAAASFLAIALGVFRDDSIPDAARSPTARATEQLSPILFVIMAVVALVILVRLVTSHPFVVSDGGVVLPPLFGLRARNVKWSEIRSIRRQRLSLREDLVFMTTQGKTAVNLRLVSDREAFATDVLDRWEARQARDRRRPDDQRTK